MDIPGRYPDWGIRLRRLRIYDDSLRFRSSVMPQLLSVCALLAFLILTAAQMAAFDLKGGGWQSAPEMMLVAAVG